MNDLLYNAAIEYQKLKSIVYKILVGRKGNSYTLMLHFPYESFFHLAGLQHLTDITFPSTNKERIFKEILKENITLKYISRSVFYESCFVRERLENLPFLKEMIESNMVTYLIHSNLYIKYTKIKADYLCEYKKEHDTLYLFCVKQRYTPKFKDECRGCSFFMKHSIDYTNNTSKTSTLLIEKHQDNKVIEIYRNPVYKEK